MIDVNRLRAQLHSMRQCRDRYAANHTELHQLRRRVRELTEAHESEWQRAERAEARINSALEAGRNECGGRTANTRVASMLWILRGRV